MGSECVDAAGVVLLWAVCVDSECCLASELSYEYAVIAPQTYAVSLFFLRILTQFENLLASTDEQVEVCGTHVHVSVQIEKMAERNSDIYIGS